MFTQATLLKLGKNESVVFEPWPTSSTSGMFIYECRDPLPQVPVKNQTSPEEVQHIGISYPPSLHMAEAKLRMGAAKRSVPFFHPGYICRVIAYLRHERPKILGTWTPSHSLIRMKKPQRKRTTKRTEATISTQTVGLKTRMSHQEKLPSVLAL